MSVKRKVIFCTYSSIYSSKILEQLIADTDIELVAIINSTRVLSPKLHPLIGAIAQLKTSGFYYCSYLFFITDFFKWAQPLFKLKKRPLRSVHALARLRNIPVHDTVDINDPKSTMLIKQYKPEVLLCAHFNQLLKAPVFALDDIEFINIHPSVLPRYKGVDPVFFAMKNNASELGVSVHEMDEDFDNGDVLLQTVITTDPSRSLLFNNCQLFEEGVRLAISWIKKDATVAHRLIIDSSNHGNYDSWPTRLDVKQFKQSGKRFMSLTGYWKQQ